MGLIDSAIFVQAGDILRATPWNSLARVIRGMMLISGFGIRLRITPNGTFISFAGRSQIFRGRFYVQMNGTSVTVGQGTVNKIEPTIKGVPISGNAKGIIPTLDIKKPVLDKNGAGYIALEVTCEPGSWAIKTVEIIQVAYLHTDDQTSGENENLALSLGGTPNLKGYRARHGLARLKKSKSGSLECYQIVYHELEHRAKTTGADPKADSGRHFFYANG